jgi:PAS domain S-box-containing protein
MMENQSDGDLNRRQKGNVLKLAYLKEEIELRWEEQELGMLIESLPIGICITDAHGRFHSVNTSYTQLYGYSPQELLGQHFSMVVPQDEQEGLSNSHDRFIQEEFELKDIWRVLRKDGTTLEILANAALLKLQDQRYKITFVVDVTDQLETERRLSDSISRLNEELRSLEDAQRMINHDVRNNVGNIAQMSEMISEGMLDEEEKAYYQRMIRSLSLRTLSFLDMLLSLRQMENGTFQLEPASVDLKALLQECCEAVLPKLHQKELTLPVTIEGKAWENAPALSIDGDGALITHAVDNLLQNAIEASPKSQTVSLSVETQGQRVCISMHNQGSVPPDVRPHFFDKYTTAGKSKGTGLGTYIARLVTEAHHGHITMNSSEEEGTTLRMCLPRVQHCRVAAGKAEG